MSILRNNMNKTISLIMFLCGMLGIAAFSCKKESPLRDNNHLGEPFLIKVNDNKLLTPIISSDNMSDSLSVTFKNVLFDSRCDMSLCYLCYGGLGRIQVFFSHKQDTGTITLSIPGCRYEYECDDQLYYHVDTLGYRFCLLRLDPYPGDSNSTTQTTYTAKLNIVKL